MPRCSAAGLGFIRLRRKPWALPVGLHNSSGVVQCPARFRVVTTGISNGVERNLHLLKEAVKFSISERDSGILVFQ